MASGTLDINVVEARNLKDCDVFCKMDPYVILHLNTEKRRTRTHTSGGRNPNWNQQLFFDINAQNPSSQLSITVYDQDIGTDEVIGTAVIDVYSAVASGYCDEWVDLRVPKTGRNAGQVHLVMTFKGISQQGAVSNNPSQPPPYSAGTPGFPGNQSFNQAFSAQQNQNGQSPGFGGTATPVPIPVPGANFNGPTGNYPYYPSQPYANAQPPNSMYGGYPGPGGPGQYPGQQYPGQQYTGQQYPGQQYPGQQYPGQAPNGNNRQSNSSGFGMGTLLAGGAAGLLTGVLIEEALEGHHHQQHHHPHHQNRYNY